MVEGNWFIVLTGACTNRGEFDVLIGINIQSKVDNLQIDMLV